MSPQYFERPTGERLATLEADMAYVKRAQDETRVLVQDIHEKVMQGSGIATVLKQGGTWMVMIVSGTLGGLVTTAFHRLI